MTRGQRRSLVATCSRGLEEVLAGELAGLGYPGATPGRGSVGWLGDDRAVVRANLWLRAATRVLVSLAEGAAGDRGTLYELASSIAWEELVGPGQTVAVDVAGKGSGFASTAFAALTVKDALVDRLRRRRGGRPDVDRRDADVRVHLHLGGGHASIAIDSTGEPLAHQGYRPRGSPHRCRDARGHPPDREPTARGRCSTRCAAPARSPSRRRCSRPGRHPGRSAGSRVNAGRFSRPT
jgi:23S rRNA G2445 N2-methylase RlmL